MADCCSCSTKNYNMLIIFACSGCSGLRDNTSMKTGNLFKKSCPCRCSQGPQLVTSCRGRCNSSTFRSDSCASQHDQRINVLLRVIHLQIPTVPGFDQSCGTGVPCHNFWQYRHMALPIRTFVLVRMSLRASR